MVPGIDKLFLWQFFERGVGSNMLQVNSHDKKCDLAVIFRSTEFVPQ